VALLAARVTGPILDGLAITILVARICQNSIHLLVEQLSQHKDEDKGPRWVRHGRNFVSEAVDLIKTRSSYHRGDLLEGKIESVAQN